MRKAAAQRNDAEGRVTRAAMRGRGGVNLFFVKIALPLILDPALMAQAITTDSNTIGFQTGVDAVFELMVIGCCVLVYSCIPE